MIVIVGVDVGVGVGVSVDLVIRLGCEIEGGQFGNNAVHLNVPARFGGV